MEEYPSLVEGTGLENQEVGDGAGVRIPFPPPFIFLSRDRAVRYLVGLITQRS